MEQFKEMALRHFVPLTAAHGLQPGERSRDWLEFKNSRAVLWVGWDVHRTREISTSIALLYDKNDRYYEFGFELYLILRFKEENTELIRDGAVQPEQLDDELRCRAALIQRYCGKLLDGDANEFNDLKVYVRKDSHEYTWRMNRRTLTEEAEKAWAATDYDRVMRLVSPYEDLLDTDWQRKLAAARSAISSQKQQPQ